MLTAVVKSVDMSEDMQSEAIEVAHEALEKYSVEKVSTSLHRTTIAGMLIETNRTLHNTSRKRYAMSAI